MSLAYDFLQRFSPCFRGSGSVMSPFGSTLSRCDLSTLQSTCQPFSSAQSIAPILAQYRPISSTVQVVAETALTHFFTGGWQLGVLGPHSASTISSCSVAPAPRHPASKSADSYLPASDTPTILPMSLSTQSL